MSLTEEGDVIVAGVFAKIRRTLLHCRFIRVLSQLFRIIESGHVHTKNSVNCEHMFLSRIFQKKAFCSCILKESLFKNLSFRILILLRLTDIRTPLYSNYDEGVKKNIINIALNKHISTNIFLHLHLINQYSMLIILPRHAVLFINALLKIF